MTAIERLSITSFIENGHTFDLYSYGAIQGIPEGTQLRNAAEILPVERVFRYRDHSSYAGFSNFFRYKLLSERGGWWVDLDAVCLKPFDFDDEFVFCPSSSRMAGRCRTSGSSRHPVEAGSWTPSGRAVRPWIPLRFLGRYRASTPPRNPSALRARGKRPGESRLLSRR